MSEPPPIPTEMPRVRQCGRCRETFPADATADAIVLQEWWACPSCRDALFGAAGRRS